jgi:PKD domain-containing protein/dockerin type I repeat protein
MHSHKLIIHRRRVALAGVVAGLVLAGMLVGALFGPTDAQAGGLQFDNGSESFSSLDGSASDLDGTADGTLTLDRLDLSGNASIVIDRPTARFAVSGRVVLAGKSSIRPSNMAQGPGIEIRAESIQLLGNATIVAAGETSGGQIRLCTTGNIEIGGRALVSASALDAVGKGGSVHLEAGNRVVIQDAAATVQANGGSGGEITLISCSAAAGGRREAAISIHGRIEAVGSKGPGGSVEIIARQGGVAVRPSQIAIDASGVTDGNPREPRAGGKETQDPERGSVLVTAATQVVPAAPPTKPSAIVAIGSPSNDPCDCSEETGITGLVISADVDRTTGVTGTQFTFNGRVVKSTSPVQQWHWRLTDGREFTGASVFVAFPAPGLYGAHLMATDQQGNVVHAETGVIVFDPTTQAPPELGLPKQIGDVDDDGLITLSDAHKVSKHAGRLELLPASAEPAADVDLDERVTPDDARLLGQAVAAGAPLPRALLPARGAPGARINLISPVLLDPMATVEIAVGQSLWVQQPLRLVRGYATFVIPFDATNSGSMQVTPGPVEVRVVSNGVVVDTLKFQVEAPLPLPANPKAELRKLLDDYVKLLQVNQDAIKQLLDQALVDGDERELLLAAYATAHEDVAAKMAKLRALLDEPGGDELARLLLIYANANGYPEFRQRLTELMTSEVPAMQSSLRAMSVNAAAPSIDEILRVLCNMKKAAGMLSTGSDILSFGCDALLIAAVVAVAVPADGPLFDVTLLFAWVSGCGTIETTLELSLMLNDFVDQLEANLRFNASTTAPQAGENVKLRATLEIVGINDLCSFGVGQSRDKLIEEVGKRAVKRLLRKKLALRAISSAIGLLAPKYIIELENRLGAALARVINRTAVGDALTEFSDKICRNLNAGVPIDYELNATTLQGPNPNVGTRTFPGDGTADYMCPAQGGSSADSVTFTVSRQICDKTEEKTVTVSCRSRPVTITMGDNGTALDDIFEVRIQGQTVLTSSSPVRSISTTVNLAAGDHTVQMIGRAAPDGIGTYFIQFSGATVIGGAPLSGSDLTPGVVKSFTIRVQ